MILGSMHLVTTLCAVSRRGGKERGGALKSHYQGWILALPLTSRVTMKKYVILLSLYFFFHTTRKLIGLLYLNEIILVKPLQICAWDTVNTQ